MGEDSAPTLAAAQAHIPAVQPAADARTRNAFGGAVSGLSPNITDDFVSLTEVLAGVDTRHTLDVHHKFVCELGWRASLRHVWRHRVDGNPQSLHQGLLPDEACARELPADMRQACRGVPCRFNADDLARYALSTWHGPGSLIDPSDDTLDEMAHRSSPASRLGPGARLDCAPAPDPWQHADPPDERGWTLPRAASVADGALLVMAFSGWVAVLAGWYTTEIGRQPWLVHGVLTTAQAAGPVPAPTIALTLAIYVAMDLALIVAYIATVFRLARKLIPESPPRPATGSLPGPRRIGAAPV